MASSEEPSPPATELSNTEVRTQKILLSAEEAAHLLGVHRSTAYQLMTSGGLKSVKIGRRRLIPRSALTDFVIRNTREGLD